MEYKRTTLPAADAYNFPYRGYGGKDGYKMMYKELKISKSAYSNLRASLLSSQNYQCAYCLCDLRNTRANVEHVIAVKRGGTNHLSNLVASCGPCNKKKGNRDLKKLEKHDLSIRLKKLKKKSLKKQREYMQRSEDAKYFIPHEMRVILSQEW